MNPDDIWNEYRRERICYLIGVGYLIGYRAFLLLALARFVWMGA